MRRSDEPGSFRLFDALPERGSHDGVPFIVGVGAVRGEVQPRHDAPGPAPGPTRTFHVNQHNLLALAVASLVYKRLVLGLMRLRWASMAGTVDRMTVESRMVVKSQC